MANIALLLNMARRAKFSIAQPTTIVGFLLAGLLLVADVVALTSERHYGITIPGYEPARRHALTQAFYYAIFASTIYIIVGLLMCLTVYGAIVGRYSKEFHLTSSQRTLMLQTMSFLTYLMLGALVFSYLEDWEYLDGVYWADVTLLTVGLGDYHPTTNITRGLLIPFAIGGVLMVGLVVGSIRSLILERGKEKLGARIVEKRRAEAVHNVDGRKQTIKISFFARADFSTDESLSPAQKREEEFIVMRKVQRVAERERRYFALLTSSLFALIIWLVGAVVFMESEYLQGWSYLDSVYFAYTSLLTIGYGDFSPKSNSGKAFFVLWSLLAVPSLTILISNMGDTVVKWFSDVTIWIGSITVLPDDVGMRQSFRKAGEAIAVWCRDNLQHFTPPGILGMAPPEHEKRTERTEYEQRMLDRLAERLNTHIDDSDLGYEKKPDQGGNDLEKDNQFYHYVLARECRNLQKDLTNNPSKQYNWADWEYFLKLMGNEDDPVDFPGQEFPDILVPDQMRAPKDFLPGDMSARTDGQQSSGDEQAAPPSSSSSEEADKPLEQQADGNVDRKTSIARQNTARRQAFRKGKWKHRNPDAKFSLDWSWLSNESPLMSRGSEAEWILDRLSAALERELNRQRKGYKRRPPISLKDARRDSRGEGSGSAEGTARGTEQSNLEKAARGEA